MSTSMDRNEGLRRRSPIIESEDIPDRLVDQSARDFHQQSKKKTSIFFYIGIAAVVFMICGIYYGTQLWNGNGGVDKVQFTKSGKLNAESMDVNQVRVKYSDVIGPAKFVATALTNDKLPSTLWHDVSDGARAKNIIISTYSVESALSIAFVGAAGNTLHQFIDLVQPNSPNRRRSALEIYATLMSSSEYYSHTYPNTFSADESQNENNAPFVAVANRVWLFTDIDPRHKALVSNLVSTELNTKQLSGAQKATVVNDWVSQTTQGKIPTLVGADVFTEELQLLITNAVYFRALFEKPFASYLTRNRPFYTNAQRDSIKLDKVRTMADKGGKQWYIDDYNGFEIVMLPYKKSDFQLILARPNTDALPILQVNDLKSLNLKQTQIDFYLPKFDFSFDIELSAILKSMGLSDAFDHNKADFSATVSTAKEQGLAITGVIHKAIVEVNEKGTVAAGATAIMMGLASMPQPHKEVNFNHPFDFYIWDNAHKLLLFSGTVSSPTEPTEDDKY